MQSFNAPIKPRAFECFLCPGSLEFDLKGHPGCGEFLTLPGWGGEYIYIYLYIFIFIYIFIFNL